MTNLALFLAKRQLGLKNHHIRETSGRKDGHFSLNKTLKGHFGCVNAVEFSRTGGFLASAGDDTRILLRKAEGHFYNRSATLKAKHGSNIFCLAFNRDASKLFSGGNDDQVIVHDLANDGFEPLDVYPHDDPVHGVSAHPELDPVFLSASSDGFVRLFDMRTGGSAAEFGNEPASSGFHSVQFNPADGRLLASASEMYGCQLWDVRNAKRAVLRYDDPLITGGNAPNLKRNAMSVKFNSSGSHLFVLRRRMNPVLFALHNPVIVCEFSDPDYANSCTMKCGSFCGQSDQFVISGADDFNVYLWKIPDDESGSRIQRNSVKLSGHRSIVNQVRYSDVFGGLIASCGVEKTVNLWSNAGSNDAAVDIPKRNRFTMREYTRFVLEQDSPAMNHDYSAESVEENERMLAFFDTLIERDRNDETSSDSDDDDVVSTIDHVQVDENALRKVLKRAKCVLNSDLDRSSDSDDDDVDLDIGISSSDENEDESPRERDQRRPIMQIERRTILRSSLINSDNENDGEKESRAKFRTRKTNNTSRNYRRRAIANQDDESESSD